MKILFITHRLPCPPDRGCKVRSAAILHRLAERHEVWCAGFLDRDGAPELRAEMHRSLASLRQRCPGLLAVPHRPTLAAFRALGGLLIGGTATESYFSSGALRRGVLEWSRRIGFDAVFAFSSGIAPLALELPVRRRVLCMDDLDSRKWQDLGNGARGIMKRVYAAEARRLATRELKWLTNFDATLMVNRREADLVSDPKLRQKVHIIPPILPSLPDFDESRPAGKTEPIVGFVGAMDYAPNVDAVCWFAREVWPRIRRQCPDSTFLLVGRSPPPAIRELAGRSGIVVTGAVPDVAFYLNRMRVHVAPLRLSRGVQIKVLGAMAAGRPCVVTSCVAEGLSVRPGRDCLVADSPALFAAAVVDLLKDPGKAHAVGEGGRKFLRQLDPEAAIIRIERLLAGEPQSETDGLQATDNGTEDLGPEARERVLVVR